MQTCDIDLTVFPRVYPRYGFVINFSNPPVVGTDEIQKSMCFMTKNKTIRIKAEFIKRIIDYQICGQNILKTVIQSQDIFTEDCVDQF